MGKAKFIQENGETILPITHEEAVLDNDGKNLPSKYQQKQDENLLTDSKTIVGAINELSTKGGEGTITSVSYTEGSDLSIEQIVGDITTNDVKLPNSNTTLTEELDVYDTRVQDVENIALANQDKIGETELATTDKTLTGAINELFQNVDSGKQLIADAIDEDSITKDSTFQAMSDKIAEIKNNNGGLDIISATELPATGKENQLCILTDTTPPTIFVTPNTSGANLNDNNIRLFLADDYRSSKGIISTVSNGVSYDYYLESARQNSKGLDAYVYNNGSWEQLLKPIIVAFDYGYSDLGVSTGSAQVINSNNIMQLYIQNAYWTSLCFQQVIDFSKYSTCEVTFTGGDSANGSTHNFYVINSSSSTSTINSSLSSFSYSEITSSMTVSLSGVSEATPKTITIDISSLNGSGYFGIINFHQPLTYTTTNISKIIIY